MKQHLIRLTLVVLAWGGLILSAQGADLIVEENGVLPNYSNISNAVAAASNGDRIFVKNKTGNIPYQENVTIDKSIELLAFDADGFFYVQGNYTLVPASDRTITIIGMVNSAGSITASTTNNGPDAARINLLSNQLNAGSITINSGYVIAHISGNQLNSGSITMRFGMATGNQINSGFLYFNAPTNTNIRNNGDTLYVVGNKLNNGRISLSNAYHWYHVSNNYVNYSSSPIDINAMKQDAGTHWFINNSVRFSSRNAYGMDFTSAAVGATTKLEIQNNAFMRNGSQGGMDAIYLWSVSGFVTIAYNAYQGVALRAGTATNTVQVANIPHSTGSSINTTSGECTAAPCIDAGNPGPDFTDIDFSRNNCGAAGGSFNINNFHPILVGGARVYLVKTPRKVINTNVIRAEAESHDR